MISTTEMLRHQNRARVLAGLRELGPSAHTTLSEWTGLSSASVSAITAELEDEAVLQRLEQVASSGRGRPRVLFGPNPEFVYLATIRIATELVEYSLVDYAGILTDRFHEARPANEKSVKTFIKRVKAGIVRLAERNDLKVASIQSISITTKGVVDRDAATLRWSPVFGDQAIDFAKQLSEVCAAPVSVHNETAFSAQAVARRIRREDGDAENGRQVAVLSLGHSIGLGVASLRSHGRIEGFAPPFGHMINQQDGQLCRCGAFGCVEATAGFYGILRTAFDVPVDTIPARFVPLNEVDTIATQARAGKHNAELAFRKAGECLGLALARLNCLLPVSEITITGYGVRYIDLLLPKIEQQLEKTMQANLGLAPVIHIDTEETQLVHEGNTQRTLADLDEFRVATRQLSSVKAAG